MFTYLKGENRDGTCPSLISLMVSVAIKHHVYQQYVFSLRNAPRCYASVPEAIVWVLQNCLLRNKPDCSTPEICCGLFLFLLDCSIRCLSHSSFRSGLNHTTHRIRFHKDRLRKNLHTVDKNVCILFLKLKT